MANHNDGVNPLRPYYIPPSIGEPPEVLPTPGPRAFAQANSTGRYASKARDIFSDIDYKDYEPSPSVVQTVKEVLDELLWKYTSVLMAQPFEVAKTIMQVRAQDDLGGLAAAAEAAEEAKQRQANQRINMYDEVGALSPCAESSRDPTDSSPGRPLRLRLGPRRVGLFHLAPATNTFTHPHPLKEPETSGAVPTTTAVCEARTSPPARHPDTRLGIRSDRPALAERRRLGRLERFQRNLHLLGPAIPPRELVPQPPQRALQRARLGRQERHGPPRRHRLPLPLGLPLRRRRRRRRNRPHPLPSRPHPHSVRSPHSLCLQNNPTTPTNPPSQPAS